MKTNFKFLSLAASLMMIMVLWSCETNPDLNSEQDLLPAKFSVEIPSSISNADISNGRRSGRLNDDVLQGNDIYLHLNTFIAIGEGASQLVEGIINGIRIHHIDRVKSLTFVSEDDGRDKNLVVFEDVTFEGHEWDYQLTITDADSEGEGDGGKAIQIFWNHSTPIEGIAIIKPYNCDRSENAAAPNTMFRINYSEISDDYDAQMEVLISGLPLANPINDPYSVSTLRMFAGKKGDVVDVFGNSNHPNAILFAGDAGFNWAFIASGNESTDKGVAEVGLPPSDLNSDDRQLILKDYSIENVFTNEITSVWPGIDPTLLNTYLQNTAAPGYFNEGQGFLAGGVSPGTDWDVLATRLESLSPFNPSLVSNLTVEFK
jgi:hypothetical protein